MIYFLLDRARGLIKIGQSGRLAGRIKEQDVFDNPAVVLLGVNRGRRHSECCFQEYVECFSERVGKTDWFRLNPQLALFIDGIACEPEAEDWARGASNDDDPQAVTIRLLLTTNSWGEWERRLCEHIGPGGGGVIQKALEHFAKSHGFNEPPPELSKPSRGHPILKVSENGVVLLRLDGGKYVPAIWSDDEYEAPDESAESFEQDIYAFADE